VPFGGESALRIAMALAAVAPLAGLVALIVLVGRAYLG
jgi:hypothetical protein